MRHRWPAVLYTSFAWCKKGYREIVRVYGGGIRKLEGRYSDPGINLVCKIKCLGAVT